MLAKSTLLLALFAASSQIAVAANIPGCLLGAINTAENPADVKAVCSDPSDVESEIRDKCGDNADAAMEAFRSVCKDAGVTISDSSSSTTTKSASETGSATASKTSDLESATTESGKESATATSAIITKGASTMVYTSEYSDSDCSCTKTSVISTTIPASTAFATQTGGGTISSGAAAGNGSNPTAPLSPTVPASVSSSVPVATGAAALPTAYAGSFAALVIGAGVALAL